MLLQNNDYKQGSIREIVAAMVWTEDKEIYINTIGSIIISNINPQKTYDQFMSLVQKIKPHMKDITKEKARLAKEEMDRLKDKVFVIGSK